MPRRRKNSPLQQTVEAAAVAAYIRVSTEDQARSGLGLEAQRTRCAAMALVKDWPEPVFYADEGISGTKGPKYRPALAQLLADVKAGLYRAVIISSLDRLGRKTLLVLQLVDEFRADGIALVSCKESLDTATAQGQFVLTMFAAVSQLERDLIADRTKAALSEIDRKDGDRGGRLPFGYKRVERTIVIDRHAATIVRCIFDWRAENQTLRAIAGHLNKRHGTSPLGGKWSFTTVKDILDNREVYEGGLRGNTKVRWPAIVKSDEAQAS